MPIFYPGQFRDGNNHARRTIRDAQNLIQGTSGSGVVVSTALPGAAPVAVDVDGNNIDIAFYDIDEYDDPNHVYFEG